MGRNVRIQGMKSRCGRAVIAAGVLIAAVLMSAVPSKADTVATGLRHTCAVSAEGALSCWGDNADGQIGTALFSFSTTPSPVTGVATGVFAVTAGNDHSCAIVSGAAKCWGSGERGQLGNGSISYGAHPQIENVTGLSSGVTSISAGGYHTCAVVNGAAKCWGANSRGQLGNGSSADSIPSPVGVSGLGSGVVSVTAGASHSCALLTTGAVKCWGGDSEDQLGDSASGDSSSLPVSVAGIDGSATAVEAGAYHTCALVVGGVKCWGSNWSGAVGDGTKITRATPVNVSGLSSGVMAVSAGWDFSCAVVTSGAVKCWGGASTGRLGNGSTTGSPVPVDVSGIDAGAIAVSAGSGHACASIAGTLKCWGLNSRGQLGIGVSVSSTTPAAVEGLVAGIASISAGPMMNDTGHSCAVGVAGAIHCWGLNWEGQLGDGSRGAAATPVAVSGISSGATSVATGAGHSCAVVSGAAKCWGSNWTGQLGDGSANSFSTFPVGVSNLAANVSAISAGADHSCAIVSGAAKCWGWNNNGQIGDGTTAKAGAPASVSDLTSGVSAISAGYAHSCAVVEGAAKCWGDNSSGELGNGLVADSATPVQVSTLTSGVTAIAAGNGRSCAVASGAVRCWGNGVTTPVAVAGLESNVTAIAGGWGNFCAIQSGVAKCWGANFSGQLGDGTVSPATTPVTPQGLTGGVTSIAAGGGHSCAAVNGSAKCWGYGEDGQLGNGSAWKTTPVTVTGFTVLDPPAEPPTGGGSTGGGDAGSSGPTGGSEVSDGSTSWQTPVAPNLPAPASGRPEPPVAPKKAKLDGGLTVSAECETACTLSVTLKIGKKNYRLPVVNMKAGSNVVKITIPRGLRARVKSARKRNAKARVRLRFVVNTGLAQSEPIEVVVKK